MEFPSIEPNGYLCESKPPVETLPLSPLPSSGESVLEAYKPPVFSLDYESQIVFNVILTLHLSIASMGGFQNSTPNPTHASALVTPPTLWWLTSLNDKYLTLNSLTLDSPYINTSPLSLFIPPSSP